ncbi:MAG: GC-type dockerin domain-anchored protein, partial [Planctomycetota bacterium]
TPFSTTNFDDPNHSYRTWGNDGSTFDLQIRRRGNRMVGEAIATALFEHTQGLGGHIPVFLDLLLPARVGAPQRVGFGRVPVGQAVEVEVAVSNAGDVALWQRDDSIAAPAGGIQPLRYTLEGDATLSVPSGTFSDEAGGDGVVHRIGVDTTVPGAFEAILRVVSNAPDEPSREIRIVGEIAACLADLDGDGSLSIFDFLAFQNLFDASDPTADLDGDGELTLFDFLEFQNLFDAGC